MIDGRAFREAIRTVTVSYPIPFLSSALLAFALACFAGALLTGDALRYLLAGAGFLSMLTAVLTILYSVLHRPELLRSERFTLLSRYFEVIGDTTMTPADRDRVTALLLSTQGDETRKVPETGIHSAEDHSGDSDD